MRVGIGARPWLLSVAGHAVLAALVWAGVRHDAAREDERPSPTVELALVAPPVGARDGAWTAVAGPALGISAAGERAAGGPAEAPRRRERRAASAEAATAAASGGAGGDPFAIEGVSMARGDGWRSAAPPAGGGGGAASGGGDAASGGGDAASGGGGGGGGEGPVGGHGADAAGRGPPARTVDAEAVRAAVQASARYPRLARERGLEGTVVLRFRIRADGTVEDLRVLGSAGEALDAAALDAVRRAQPFRSGAGTVRIPVVFELRPAP